MIPGSIIISFDNLRALSASNAILLATLEYVKGAYACNEDPVKQKWAKQGAWFFCSNQEVMEALGWELARIQSNLRSLERLGLVYRKRRGLIQLLPRAWVLL